MLIREGNDKQKKRSTSTKARARRVGYWKADKEESEKSSKPRSPDISEKAHAYRVAHGAKDGPKTRSQIQINAAKLRAAKAGAKRRVGTRNAQIAKKYKERLSSTNPNNPNKYTKGMNYIRKERASRGEFAGDYYGPDQFKGDIDMVDKWRKYGGKKSDIKKVLQLKKNS